MSRAGPHRSAAGTSSGHHPHHHPGGGGGGGGGAQATAALGNAYLGKSAAANAVNMAHKHDGSTGSTRQPSSGNGVASSTSHAGGEGAGTAGAGGRRKQKVNQGQNLNHLLSFTLPPRAPPPSAYARRSSRRAGGGSGGGGGGWHAYDKERYLNAQYRFLVKPTEDYTAHFADPDIYLPWSHIVQVLIPTSSALSGATTGLLPSQAQDAGAPSTEGATCPICLSPPSAPRITRCGHVYCYPCILHYLATSADAAPASHGPAARVAVGHDAQAHSASGASTPLRGIPGASRTSSSSHVATSASTSGMNTPTRRPPPPGSAEAVASASTTYLPRLQKFSRCPICGDPVYARDLKAVKWWDARGAERKYTDAMQSDVASTRASLDVAKSSSPSYGDEYLTLRLIERPHFTTLALPQSSTWPPSVTGAAPSTSDRNTTFLDPETRRALELSSSPSLPPVDVAQANSSSREPRSTTALGGPIPTNAAPWHFLPDVMTFAKFMLATPAYLLSSLAEDLSELAVERAMLDGSQPGSGGVVDELGLVFVAMAQRKVEEQMDKVRNELDTQWVRRRINLARAELAHCEEVEEGERPNDSSKGTRTRRNLNPPAPNSSSSLFYQAASGQNIFLHPLDIKVLRTQYHSYALFPRQIRVKVGGADESTVNADLRRRCKYLSHLPMSADVVFIEIDWEGMVAEAEADQRRSFAVEAKTEVEDDTMPTPTQEEPEEHDLEKTISALPPPLTKPHPMQSLAASAPAPTITASGLPIIQRATLKPYEQALRQRRQRRTDKARKEDRAKLRAEEADRAASAAALAGLGAGYHGVVNGGRNVRALEMGAGSVSASSRGRRSEGGYDSSSVNGGGGVGAGDDQYGQSFTSSSKRGGALGAGPSSFGSGFVGSASPSFREAAMVGAERVFPIHPGAEAAEVDFPDILRSHASSAEHRLDGDDDHTSTSSEEGDGLTAAHRPVGSRRGTAKPTPSSGATPKTVWGTPSARRPWASSAASHQDDYAGWSEMDDAWLELEEDFILSTEGGGGGGHGHSHGHGHGQRRTSSATMLLNKESRGFNSQQHRKQQGQGNDTPTKTRTRPMMSTRGSGASLVDAPTAGAPTAGKAGTGDESKHGDAGVSVQDTNLDKDAAPDDAGAATTGRKAKPKKKKLVLTSGGRGR